MNGGASFHRNELPWSGRSWRVPIQLPSQSKSYVSTKIVFCIQYRYLFKYKLAVRQKLDRANPTDITNYVSTKIVYNIGTIYSAYILQYSTNWP
jgi:hypothetical protein